MPNVGAAVGVRQSTDGNLTAGGTFTTTPRPPVQAADTVLQSNIAAGDLNMAQSLQPSGDPRNPVQEVNLFVGEMARLMACGPTAAIVRIQDILTQLRLQYFT